MHHWPLGTGAGAGAGAGETLLSLYARPRTTELPSVRRASVEKNRGNSRDDQTAAAAASTADAAVGSKLRKKGDENRDAVVSAKAAVAGAAAAVAAAAEERLAEERRVKEAAAATAAAAAAATAFTAAPPPPPPPASATATAATSTGSGFTFAPTVAVSWPFASLSSSTTGSGLGEAVIPGTGTGILETGASSWPQQQPTAETSILAHPTSVSVFGSAFQSAPSSSSVATTAEVAVGVGVGVGAGTSVGMVPGSGVAPLFGFDGGGGGMSSVSGTNTSMLTSGSNVTSGGITCSGTTGSGADAGAGGVQWNASHPTSYPPTTVDSSSSSMRGNMSGSGTVWAPVPLSAIPEHAPAADADSAAPGDQGNSNDGSPSQAFEESFAQPRELGQTQDTGCGGAMTSTATPTASASGRGYGHYDADDDSDGDVTTPVLLLSFRRWLSYSRRAEGIIEITRTRPSSPIEASTTHPLTFPPLTAHCLLALAERLGTDLGSITLAEGSWLGTLLYYYSAPMLSLTNTHMSNIPTPTPLTLTAPTQP